MLYTKDLGFYLVVYGHLVGDFEQRKELGQCFPGPG